MNKQKNRERDTPDTPNRTTYQSEKELEFTCYLAEGKELELN